MKKNISILSIALVAGLFAAGCSKGLEDCSKATKAADCIDSKKFKDEAKCVFEFTDATKTGDDAAGTCKKAADVDLKAKCAGAAKSGTGDFVEKDCTDSIAKFKSASTCALKTDKSGCELKEPAKN